MTLQGEGTELFQEGYNKEGLIINSSMYSYHVHIFTEVLVRDKQCELYLIKYLCREYHHIFYSTTCTICTAW